MKVENICLYNWRICFHVLLQINNEILKSVLPSKICGTSVSIAAFSSIYMDFFWKFYDSEITMGISHRDLNQVMLMAMAVLQYKLTDNCLVEY
jgi:hypothetical protein